MKSDMTNRRGLAGYTTATALMLGLAGGLAPAQAQMTAGANPFWTDAKAGYMFRSSYFDRRSSGDNVGTGTLRQQAMGLGGWLYGTTGEVGNTLSLGGTYNFTVPLYAPDDTPFNYILRDPGQDPVSVIGEAYGKLRFGNHAFVIGRQSINQAWYMDDVVRFYNQGGHAGGFLGKRDRLVFELDLSPDEIADLVDFLQTLTGAPVAESWRRNTSR